MATTKPIPQGAHTLTPNLVLRDCAKAIEFYKKALGAQELMRMPSPDGKLIWHAELKIGDSTFYLNDEMPGMSTAAPSPEHPAPTTFWLWTEDADAAYRKATQAGATSRMEPADMFWGDRCAGVADPFGYSWSFATHVKDLSDDEVRRAGAEFARQWEQQHQRT
ncbi:Glyoxalase/bleomycin resistance protein/dioxygenase [Anaeromyxobacter sp. K]|uniref:VOC family protein n=1 Tax=Anaeromyxobacter sp. (strain K) TaxID=447217 RepID=UPI00015F92DA|nr:VOC family protein [Anaeromyxobacter sp. K]ACG75230.1 Glyoxalase/bleomycin resistance protein/dioxygenase [Anaeromyxobacter sp. K]